MGHRGAMGAAASNAQRIASTVWVDFRETAAGGCGAYCEYEVVVGVAGLDCGMERTQAPEECDARPALRNRDRHPRRAEVGVGGARKQSKDAGGVFNSARAAGEILLQPEIPDAWHARGGAGREPGARAFRAR